MVFIKDYVEQKLQTYTAAELASELGVSISMITAYKLHDYNASLAVAKRVYGREGVVLHPFSEKSLKHELNIKEEK